MGIEYRTYQYDRDYTHQRELFSLSFPETMGTPVESKAHYLWKFQEFPATPPSYQYVGSEHSGLVGYYAALPFRYTIGNTIYKCGMVCDVMTHPERRGKGIFTEIGRYAVEAMRQEGLGFTTGYPVRSEVIPGHLKVGWRIVQKMYVYVRPVGARSLLPSILRPVAPIANIMIRGIQVWSHMNPPRYTSETLSRDTFFSRVSTHSEYEHFLATWVAQQDNALIKDLPFLRWRTGAPTAEYYFLSLRFEGHLVGLAIARPTRLKEIETLAVLDFMVLDEHLPGCRALHSGLSKLAQAKGKDLVACMTSVKWAKAYRFAGSCYVRTSAIFSLIVKKLQPEISDESLYNEKRWHTFWIDSDDL
jgi:GNAT superfamily N-acetyltransferase